MRLHHVKCPNLNVGAAVSTAAHTYIFLLATLLDALAHPPVILCYGQQVSLQAPPAGCCATTGSIDAAVTPPQKPTKFQMRLSACKPSDREIDFSMICGATGD